MMIASAPVDGGGEIGCRPLDRGEPSGLALDDQPARSADVGKSRVVEVVQTQAEPGKAEICQQIDAADAGADDCDRSSVV